MQAALLECQTCIKHSKIRITPKYKLMEKCHVCDKLFLCPCIYEQGLEASKRICSTDERGVYPISKTHQTHLIHLCSEKCNVYLLMETSPKSEIELRVGSFATSLAKDASMKEIKKTLDELRELDEGQEYEHYGQQIIASVMGIKLDANNKKR
jgi:hypothetical protein